MKISAEFVTSAAGAEGLPRDGTPEVALVGRSNVGKSSLINALVRQRVARTSRAPGRTRLANIYRVQRGAAPPLYLADLPGYGYARGGLESARAFQALTSLYFDRPGSLRRAVVSGAILAVDARHPGLRPDLDAHAWLIAEELPIAVVGTKIDKLSRVEGIRARRELENTFKASVLPVSAVTGEGLEELWKLIAKLVSSHQHHHPRTDRQEP